MTRWRGRLFGLSLGLLAAFASIEAGSVVVSAEPFRSPQISVVRVDWRAARDQLRSELSAAPALAADFAFVRQQRVGNFDPRSVPAVVQLSAATSAVFSGIGRSTVPVLLPFDTPSFLEARQSGVQSAAPLSRYQADFRPVDFFDASPAG